MTATATPTDQLTFELIKEITINTSIDVAFGAMLEQLGELNATLDGQTLNMKLEAWPGGRWFRDLGNNTGHLWGHVQVIKPPTVLEIVGPMFMSYAVISHIQYRFTEDNDTTLLSLTHRACGMMEPQHREGVSHGWGNMLEQIRNHAEGQ